MASRGGCTHTPAPGLPVGHTPCPCAWNPVAPAVAAAGKRVPARRARPPAQGTSPAGSLWGGVSSAPATPGSSQRVSSQGSGGLCTRQSHCTERRPLSGTQPPPGGDEAPTVGGPEAFSGFFIPGPSQHILDRVPPKLKKHVASSSVPGALALWWGRGAELRAAGKALVTPPGGPRGAVGAEQGRGERVRLVPRGPGAGRFPAPGRSRTPTALPPGGGADVHHPDGIYTAQWVLQCLGDGCGHPRRPSP